MQVVFTVNTGYANLKHEEILDFDDDTTDDELDEHFENWVWERIDGNWNKLV